MIEALAGRTVSLTALDFFQKLGIKGKRARFSRSRAHSMNIVFPSVILVKITTAGFHACGSHEGATLFPLWPAPALRKVEEWFARRDGHFRSADQRSSVLISGFCRGH